MYPVTCFNKRTKSRKLFPLEIPCSGRCLLLSFGRQQTTEDIRTLQLVPFTSIDHPPSRLTQLELGYSP